jgi:hypothetical protein
MLNYPTYYHGNFKKIIIAFGRLFSDLKIERRDQEGNLLQTVEVPIAWGPKEKWIVRVDSDPTLENNTYTTLPRLAFEILGYTYDSARKLGRMKQITCNDGSNASSSMRTPVPYNIEIALYLLTKTTEDALCAVEQILPIFTPDYTLSINSVPELNIIDNVPIILNGVSVEDEYEGDFTTRRFVTHTFNFTIKANVYGPITTQGIITTVSANVPGIENITTVGDPSTGNVTTTIN